MIECQASREGNTSNPVTIMAASLTTRSRQKVRKIQLVMSDTFPPPKFCTTPKIIVKGDSMGVLFLIPSKFIMIHDIISFYMCKVREVGDYEIREAYKKLCDEGTLKDELKKIVKKGLT